MPHLRNDAGAGQSDGGGGRKSRTDGHDAAILGRSGLTVLVFVLEMGGHIPALRMHELVSPQVSTWIQFALSTPIVLWAGWPFFQRSWALIVHRSLNMFSLIALGTGSAYLYSLFAAFAPGLFPAGFHGMGGTVPVYFEAAAVITVLVLLGQVLELRAREQTGGAIRALLKLAPKTARRCVKVMRPAVGVEAHRQAVLAELRIPTKPATHSNRKPATDSDLKPAGVPI